MRRRLRRVLDMLAHGRAARVHRSLKDEAASLHERCSEWLESKGVQGIGIGNRTDDDDGSAPLVIRVYVDELESFAELAASVPALIRSAILAMNIEFEVVEVGTMRFHAGTDRVRPVTPGFSISPQVGGAGTIGCLVRKADDPSTTYLAGAGHTFLYGRAGRLGDALFQQGIDDLGEGDEPERVATVTEAVEIEFGGSGFTNFYDVAIAKLEDGFAFDPAIPEIGVPGPVNSNLRTGMTVQKTGRTTGHTTAQIVDIDFQLAMNMRVDAAGNEQRAGFVSQVLCTRYADPGDSGAAVCSANGRLLGFHLAGSETHSVFSRAPRVLAQLELVLA